MDEQQLVGFENLLGQKVLDDPRAVKAMNDIKTAVENYEAILLILAIEHGVVTAPTT